MPPKELVQDDVGAGLDETPMQGGDAIRVIDVPEFGGIARFQPHGKEGGCLVAPSARSTPFSARRSESGFDMAWPFGEADGRR